MQDLRMHSCEAIEIATHQDALLSQAVWGLHPFRGLLTFSTASLWQMLGLVLAARFLQVGHVAELPGMLWLCIGFLRCSSGMSGLFGVAFGLDIVNWISYY